MLLLVRWASDAPYQRILMHEHRGLLLEWRALVAMRGSPPLLGWMRGNARRQDPPYLIQDYCDRVAPLGAALPPDERGISSPILVWNRQLWNREVPPVRPAIAIYGFPRCALSEVHNTRDSVTA
jgi:hypothetical protein